MGRYIEEDLLEAEEMFERLIGYPLAKATYVEVHKYQKHTGHQIKLTHNPLKIVKCEGYLKYVQLKFEGWSEIQLEDIGLMGQVLDIPASIFQVPYEKICVEYLAGVEEIPEEICLAIYEIDTHLKKDIYSWNLPLSSTTLDVIAKYKK